MENYTSLVSFLGQVLPGSFEIILFDASSKDLPIINCVNRQNGTHNASRKLVSDILRSEILRERGSVLNYPLESEVGKLIKTSVYLLKDADKTVTGVICVNMQCDVFFQMQTLVSSVLQFSSTEFDGLEQAPQKESPVYAEPSLDMITKVVEEYGVEPERVSQDERIEIMCDLYELGVFELKGAVAKTAEALQISEQSVYRYLSKIKKARM